MLIEQHTYVHIHRSVVRMQVLIWQTAIIVILGRDTGLSHARNVIDCRFLVFSNLFATVAK